jgi:hypothetical protein
LADAIWAEEQSEKDRGAVRSKKEDLQKDIRSAEKEVEACEVSHILLSATPRCLGATKIVLSILYFISRQSVLVGEWGLCVTLATAICLADPDAMSQIRYVM